MLDHLWHLTETGYYNRQGNFEKTMEAWENRAKAEPNNPEAHYTVATYYWDKANLRVNDIVESLLVHPALSGALADAAE